MAFSSKSESIERRSQTQSSAMAQNDKDARHYIRSTMMQPINSVAMSDDLLCDIISFLVPTKLSEARPLSSLMYQVSPRFGDALLQCLQSTPVSISFNDHKPGSAKPDMEWAAQNNCKVGGLSVIGDASSIIPFLAKMDLSRLKDVDIYLDSCDAGSCTANLNALYQSLVAQSAPLERIQLDDDCHVCKYPWHSWFSIQNLKRVTLNGDVFHQDVKANLEALPSLEHLKLLYHLDDDLLSFESSSLQVLDIARSSNIRITHLYCPSLTRLICCGDEDDETVIMGRPVVTLVEQAIERDEFGIQQNDEEVVCVRALVKGAKAIGSDDFRVAPDCQIIFCMFY